MLKKTPSDKINDTKYALFFLSRAPTHHSFTFNLRFSLRLFVGFLIFDSVSFLLKFIFLFNKMHGRHNSFQNENNKKATHRFVSRLLIFKLQQEVLKFNDIFVSWSSPRLTC